MTDTSDTPDSQNTNPTLSIDDELGAILAAAGAGEALAELDRQAASTSGEDSAADGKKSQATRLVELAQRDFRMVRGGDGKTYAVPNTGPNVALSLRSENGLRTRLAAAYHAETESVAGGGALSDALAVLEGQAVDREPEPVALRVARHEGNLVLDLGTADGRCIIISPGAWHMQPESPVLFRRTALTSPLPLPTRDKSGLDPLRTLLNVTESGLRLLVSWLVAALFPDIDHPILSLSGEQGTAKSTCAKIMVCLLDPSPAPLRSAPKDQGNWIVQAAASWMVMLDNISLIQPWFSDTLCKAVTGEGDVKRSLFTDDDVSVLAFQRVVGMTTIDAGALRGDLGERLLLVELEPIPKNKRRTASQVMTEYESARPAILGALLDLAAAVLAALPAVEVKELPRLADYAKILAALDKVTGWSTLPDFLALTDEITQAVIEADPFADTVRAFVQEKHEWTGTAGALLELLTPVDGVPKNWPRTGSAVSGKLRRAAPALRQQCVEVEFARDKTGRWIRLAFRTDPISPSSASSLSSAS